MSHDPYIFRKVGELGIFYYRAKEGPVRNWIVHYGHTTRSFQDPAAAIKWIKWPKSTPTGMAIRDWFTECVRLEDERDARITPPVEKTDPSLSGFGPEAQADDPDPVVNTKMVV